MFDIDTFIQDCLATDGENNRPGAIHDLLEATMSEPESVTDALGLLTDAGVDKIYVSDSLTILNVVWPPYMATVPHNHEMWAVIGMYSGREDNIFWRRVGSRVEAAGARALSTGDVELLGKDIVHSVTNPIEKYSGAIHVYGGDFFTEPRKEWEPESLEERPFDVEKNMRLFHEANARFRGAAA